MDITSFTDNLYQDINNFVSNFKNDFLPSTNQIFYLLIATLLIGFGFIAIKILISWVVKKFLSKYVKNAGKITSSLLSKIPNSLLFLLSFYFSLLLVDSEKYSNLPIINIFSFIIILVLLYHLVAFVNGVINVFVKSKIKSTTNRSKSNSLAFISVLLRTGVWIFVLTSFLSIRGLNISAILTTLGLSGLAVAIALRSTIQDFISSFVIIIDQPVRLGDIVSIGDVQGEVVHIGLRSIKIKKEDKSVVIIPNSAVVEKSIVHNIPEQNISMSVLFEIDSIDLDFKIIADKINKEAIVQDVEIKTDIKEIKKDTLIFELNLTSKKDVELNKHELFKLLLSIATNLNLSVVSIKFDK